MERVVGENEWGRLIHHAERSILELRWHESPAPMSDGGFMATLCLLALTAERLLPAAVLIDATHFRHTLGDGVIEWRRQTVIPRYGAAGVRKFGFVMPNGFPHIGSESVEDPAVFPTAWFGTRREALAWLTS